MMHRFLELLARLGEDMTYVLGSDEMTEVTVEAWWSVDHGIAFSWDHGFVAYMVQLNEGLYLEVSA